MKVFKKVWIEGPDRCGKTTLVRKFLEWYKDYPFHILHYSYVPGLNGPQMLERSKELLKEFFFLNRGLNNYNMVFDRTPIGEYVYGSIYRNVDTSSIIRMVNEEIKKNENYFFYQTEVLLVVLIDKPERIVSRDDGLSFTDDVDVISKEVKGFIDLFYSIQIPNKILISGENGLDFVLDNIKRFLENWNLVVKNQFNQLELTSHNS